ncbi:hypothetical protein SDC9_90134 [bioreactor metagenome]|uniref:Uncharacterized protein n=1 Tax=bioreactor metagenome TaxID=1076179 RepID=A0A644ZR63_9ZZZZ
MGIGIHAFSVELMALGACINVLVYILPYCSAAAFVWAVPNLSGSSEIAYWAILILGGIAVFGIIAALFKYGPSATIKAAESINPSSTGTRYRVCGILLIFISLIVLITQAVSKSSVMRTVTILHQFYVIAFSSKLLVLTARKYKESTPDTAVQAENQPQK